MSLDSFDGQLQVLCCSLSRDDALVALDTLSTITQNALGHPGEEKYRRLRIANKTFSQRVWSHQPARDFLAMVGWTEVDDTVVLLNDDFLQIALVEITKCKSLLEDQVSSAVSTDSSTSGISRGSADGRQSGKDKEYMERMAKMRELQKKTDAEKKRIAEQIKADRQETVTNESRPSRARQLTFGANLNRFEDIGVDLNAGLFIKDRGVVASALSLSGMKATSQIQ